MCWQHQHVIEQRSRGGVSGRSCSSGGSSIVVIIVCCVAGKGGGGTGGSGRQTAAAPLAAAAPVPGVPRLLQRRLLRMLLPEQR
jgi:hypothetical protein